MGAQRRKSHTTSPYHVENERLFIGDKVFRSHKIIKELGRGANGVVFLAQNTTLEREEAIKVWLKLRSTDRRNKLKQGLREAIKLARVNGNNAVQIYSAQIVGGAVVATMEYIDGETLEKFCERNKDPIARLWAAWMYLGIIEKTTTPETCHGDPHWGNVLVFKESKDKYHEQMRMKLCDFGTSIYSTKATSQTRHWRLVKETVLRVTEILEGRDQALQNLQQFEESIRTTINMMIDNADKFTAKDFAQVRMAPLRDYLDYWALLYHKRVMEQ